MAARWVFKKTNDGLKVTLNRLCDNDVVPFHTFQLWPVSSTVPIESPLQVPCFYLSVARQRVIRCLVRQGAQLGCTGSRRPAREFLQVEAFPRFLAELRFQNLHSRGFVGKIDTHSYVKSPLSN